MINYKVLPASRNEVKPIFEKWHYTHSVNGVTSDYIFKVVDSDGSIVGAALFGKPAMAGQATPYTKNGEHLTELRRFVMIDDTPRNSESYSIGRMLKWLKKHTDVDVVLSYADPNAGHSGTIYKATNFEYVGRTSKTRVIVYNGKTYHDKAIRTKNNGVLKPFAVRLKHELEIGNAYYETREGKHIYLYRIR